MFSFFKKETPTVYSPVAGQLLPLSEVSDSVFLQGMMGPGFAIKPTSDDLYSPVTGTVVSIFPTKHAIGLRRDDGKEILIHIGIDTVDLEGKGFDLFVSETDKVTPQTKLVTVDRGFLKSKGKESTVIVLFPGDNDDYSIQMMSVNAGESISLK